MRADKGLRVGEVAKQSGLTVRTLHHYDEIGLLKPLLRTEAGYRLYAHDDIVRLQRIVSLRLMGLSLEEVRTFLDGRGASLADVLTWHLDTLQAQIDAQTQLKQRLEGLLRLLSAHQDITSEQLLQAMGAMTMVEKHYTPEQLEWLKQRAATVGETRIKEVEAEWPRLIEEVRIEMEKGTDPASERVQALAKRWMGLIEEFTGGNPEIAAAVQRLYEEEPSTYNLTPGFDPKIME